VIGVSSSDTSEGSVDKSSLAFTAGDWGVEQTVTVTGVDDAVADGDVGYSVVLANAVSFDSAYDGLTPANVSVINIDDESLSRSLSCPDSGLECLERFDGGDDSTNLDTAPRMDLEFDFVIHVQDNSGSSPQYVRLLMAQRNDPAETEFYAYDMQCSGDFAVGASCSYATKLGPAAVHTYYYEMKAADGTVTEYPPSGYLAGPTIHLLNGYGLVGIPRDVHMSNLDRILSFGTPNAYRWDGALGYYTLVDSLVPVEPGEGYFIEKASTTLPEHDSLGEVQVPEYEYRLQAGWNIISNPYGGNVRLRDVMVRRNDELPVDWDTAATNGWLSNAIYCYEGSDWGGVWDYETTPDARLVPWLGYWVHVKESSNIYTLIIRKP
jgi:hypothetical protein